MKSRSLVGLLALLLLCLAAHATAQTTPTQAPTEQQRKAKKELEQKALGLLDEIIKDTQSFRVVENRLRLKAYAASLLWKYDEARARAIFKETLSGVVDLLTSQEGDDSTPRIFPGTTELRREVVQMLSVHDARMARDFLRATRQAASSAARNGEPPNDLQIEYSLATQITETDPKQALELAQDSLAKGFSYELINTLKLLQSKDPEAAAKLASEIVTKLRSETLVAGNDEAASVAFNLLSMVFDPSVESTGKDGKKAEPLLSQQGMRDLMDINVTLALNSPSYLGRLQALNGMMTQVEKYAPARVAELRRKMAQNKRTMISEDSEDGEEDSPEWAKYVGMMETGTGDELLAAAAKAPQEMRENLYQAAARKFAEKGDVDRAREIINSNLSDSPFRKELLAELERQTSLTAAEQGKMDQVRKTLANLKTNEERAMTLAQIATVLTAKGEKKLARQLLEEAQGMVSYRAKNIKQLGAQLIVAQTYIKVEPERSLAMLGSIVDQLNELLAAAVTLGGFILDEEVMRDDEIRLEVFTSLVPGFSGQFAPDLRMLAAFDFDRTRALADRFQRDEVRMMARLLVVQSVLMEQSPSAEQLRGRMTTTTRTMTITEPPAATTEIEEGDTP